jgi:hypothetical protein
MPMRYIGDNRWSSHALTWSAIMNNPTLTIGLLEVFGPDTHPCRGPEAWRRRLGLSTGWMCSLALFLKLPAERHQSSLALFTFELLSWETKYSGLEWGFSIRVLEVVRLADRSSLQSMYMYNHTNGKPNQSMLVCRIQHQLLQTPTGYWLSL